MKIADYPKTLPMKEQYTAGEIAILFGVSHRTACKMIDEGRIAGFTVPGSKERRVLYSTIRDYCKTYDNYKFVLDKFTVV